MGDIETAVRYSKEIEGLLEAHYGAVGRGLHEKVSSIESKLSSDVAKKLRHVATIRNKVVHEIDFVIKNPSEFTATCDEVIRYLNDQAISIRRAQGGRFSEESFRLLMVEAQVPIAGVLAMIGGILGMASTGLGAGIFGILLGAGAGVYMCSEAGINLLIGAFYWIVGVLVIGIVISCWNLGHPSQDGPTASKVSASTSSQAKRKPPIKKSTDPASLNDVNRAAQEN